MGNAYANELFIEDRLTGEERSAACVIPAASAEAEVILVSTYEAQALSSVAIGTQDEVTETANVEIEEGNKPLYIFLLSYSPIIWRFSGDTDRVERLVLDSALTGNNEGHKDKPPLAGAVGLPAERVTIVKSPACFPYFTEVESIAGATTIARVKETIGQRPALMKAIYKLVAISLPSLESTTLASRLSFVEWLARRYASEYWPAGVIEIDPATVTARRPVERYEVLPAQAGLMQLVDQGALTENWSLEYVINRKIRFPAGLSGAHAVNFRLPRGVPEPDGDPGHSCVIWEETGKPLRKDEFCPF
jgi:hypothetical protein